MTVELVRTRLMVPFTWESAAVTADETVDALCARKVLDRAGRLHRDPLWSPGAAGGLQRARDLEPQVLDLLGVGKKPTLGRWSIRRAHLTRAGLSQVFGQPGADGEVAVTLRGKDVKQGDARVPGPTLGRFVVDAVEALILPMGDGFVTLRLRWDVREWQALDAVCTALAGLRRLRIQKAGGCWAFGGPDVEPSGGTITPEELAAWQAREADAVAAWSSMSWVREGGTASAAEVVRALLRLPKESPHGIHVDDGRDALHTTAIVLERPPPPPELDLQLFRLRRGFDMTHGASGELSSLDHVLWVRTNRVVTVAREAAVCVGWSETGGSEAFEDDEFPRRFVGLYSEVLLLSHVESRGLVRFGTKTAALVQRVHGDEASADPRARREALREVASDILHYIAVTSWDDCGGLSDYVLVHRAQREAWQLPARRDELRSEVQGLLAMADAAYRDAQAEQAAVETRRHEVEARRESRFQGIVGGLGAFAVPGALVSGFLGMNGVGDVVTLWGVGFWHVVWASMVGGLALWISIRVALARSGRED